MKNLRSAKRWAVLLVLAAFGLAAGCRETPTEPPPSPAPAPAADAE